LLIPTELYKHRQDVISVAGSAVSIPSTETDCTKAMLKLPEPICELGTDL